MKWWFSILIILATVILPGQAFAASGPEVVNRDGKISISADHITLAARGRNLDFEIADYCGEQRKLAFVRGDEDSAGLRFLRDLL